ncbi:PAS domain S-box protein [Streptomyces fradiae ATCC 10745 = DSM 40063]|uniref:Sensor protein FixL n=1 Tax=Streptomyces fradiae ATCC 10745 = DSM 40063 TaxID=1319510 RepID=A0A1Y2P082_STRFR|nr:Sensor protein FixL [Streptomyces fradiae ATCC 10745 = DSM 40063]QEV12870.1 PAS domain S-box protein [Streptomyces fradiae ATCC 10745 = DSM 40063]
MSSVRDESAVTKEQQVPEPTGTHRPERAEELPLSPRILATAHAIAGATALAAALLGLVVLVGWIIDADALKNLLPSAGGAMKAPTAVAVTALGLSLYGVARRPARPGVLTAARAAAVLATVIGVLTLAEYATGTSLGLDELLFEDDTADVATGTPGRMAPNTAAALALAGAASLWSSTPRLPAWTSQLMGLAVVTLGMLRMYGGAYGVPELERFGAYTGMAMHTALALVLLGTSVFLNRPDEDLTGLLTNAGTTGALGRRLFAAALVVPPLLGWVVLAGVKAGTFSSRLGTALLVSAHVAAFTVMIFGALIMGRRVEVSHARLEWQVRQNELLQAFMDHTPAVVFIKDLEGRFLAVNTKFEQNLGLTRDQVLGRRYEDVMPPELARQARAADLDMLEQGRPVQREEVLAVPDGPREFLSSLFPLNDASGTPYALCGVVTDITERVAAQREVERSRQRFLALLESAPDAILITNGDGTVVMANAQVERLFGRSPDDLLGTRAVDLAPAPWRRRHRALLGAYLRSRDPRPTVVDRNLYGTRADGTPFPVEVSVSSLQAERETLVFLTVRDITERRRAEAERAERYEQQRRIAYTLQHSLMGEPPRLPHLPTAYRYLASVQDPGVGGDWFDVIPLDRHRTGVIIGDVMGRGLEAAAVMGQLRAASHALARTGTAPSRLMAALDTFVDDLADQLVTCLYLVLDQDAGEVTVCSAGHLPVIVLPPDGPARLLRAPVGVPLGVNAPSGGGVPFEEVTGPLPPGSVLALYTDGLVERPGTDIEARIGLLADTLNSAPRPAPTDPKALDGLAELLLRTLIEDPAAYDDDVTLLLISVPALPGTPGGG